MTSYGKLRVNADIYQKPVQTFESAEDGILGSPILTSVGVGVYKDKPSRAERCLRLDKN